MASGRSEKELQGVTMLGHKTDYPTDYAPQVRGGLSIDPYANYGKPGTDWEKTAKERLHFHDMQPERVAYR